MPDDQRIEAVRTRLAALLDSLDADWASVDAPHHVALYLLCGAGLVEVRFSGRAWTSQTALDFEATACGVWIDSERQSILPEEIRRAVPAWAGLAVAAQLNLPIQARLTAHGETCKRELRDAGPGLFLEYVVLHPVRGRVTVRVLGNEAPAPGKVRTDDVFGEIVKALQGIEQSQRTLAAAATNSGVGKDAAEQDLFEDIAAAAACVVGGRRCAGLSRLIAVAKLKKTVEERLRLAEQTGLLLRPDVSARELARLLNCTPAAVKKTRWWRNRMAQRRRAKADAEAPYHRKHGPRRPKWQRRGRGPHLEKPTQG